MARTIHGMVYNAMKLFMEVNPQLFDECSHEYAEHQSNADSREHSRQLKWDKVKERAMERQNGRMAGAFASPSPGISSKGATPLRHEELDPLSQDSQRRLEALRLQDDNLTSKDRRNDKQGSVSFFQYLYEIKHSPT